MLTPVNILSIFLGLYFLEFHLSYLQYTNDAEYIQFTNSANHLHPWLATTIVMIILWALILYIILYGNTIGS